MLTVVMWKWTPRRGYRSTYSAATVNTMRAMVDRHYPDPHRFVCVTDDSQGIDADVQILPDFADYADLPSPHGGKNPSCYRRLRLFHPEAARWFGERYVSIDLDMVITGDLRPLWNRTEDVVFWEDLNPQPGTHYNGSMMLIAAGTRPQVWNQFDPHRTPDEAYASRAWGSDQAIISYILGPREAKWTKADGCYSYRNDLEKNGKRLPSDARIVSLHGRLDPWVAEAQDIPWIREHYRMEAMAA